MIKQTENTSWFVSF